MAIAAIALGFNYVQFREFLRRLRARARFRVTLDPVDADPDGVIRTTANTRAARVSVGIKNEGDKAAGETLINALVPKGQKSVRWAGPGGEERLDVDSTTAPAGEGDVLTDPETGREYEPKYLSRMLPRVGTKPHHAIFFQFYVEVPDEGEARVPVRVKVQADEIPDDIEEYVEEIVVRVARAPRVWEAGRGGLT